MTIYHILVRNYFWPAGNVAVQSPIQDLSTIRSSPIIRPLAGVNKGEPRFLDNTTSLVEQEPSEIYTSEAHGVFVAANSVLERIPIWVPGRQQREPQCHLATTKHDKKLTSPATGETVVVADLTKSEWLQVGMNRICWVPTREASDGRICTVIASQVTVGRKKMSHVLLQSIGSPGSAKFVLLTTQELAEFSEINEGRKKQLFEIQLMLVLKQRRTLSPPLKQALRLVLASHTQAVAKRLFWDILDEGAKVSRCLMNETSESSLWEDADSVLESICDSHLGDVASLSLIAPWKCAYPLSWSTLDDPYPPLRHIFDYECYDGRQHKDHCVFAEHSPTVCMIPDSQHRHCSIRPRADAMSISFLDATPVDRQDEIAESSCGTPLTDIERRSTPLAFEETSAAEATCWKKPSFNISDMHADQSFNAAWVPHGDLTHQPEIVSRNCLPTDWPVFNIDQDILPGTGANTASASEHETHCDLG